MGTIYLDILVKRLPSDTQGVSQQFLVDTGAVYTLAPGDLLRQLGITSHRTLTLTLADGSKTQREMGGAYFEYQGTGGVAPVLFGVAGDMNLLGVTTLEALGVMIDPLTRDLRYLPAMLAKISIG